MPSPPPGPIKMLPQRTYHDRSKGSWGEEIKFAVHGKPGFPLQHAIDRRYTGLNVRDEPFETDSTSISIRVEVREGIPESDPQKLTKIPSPVARLSRVQQAGLHLRKFIFSQKTDSQQFKTRNWKNPPTAIPKEKLATEIAKVFTKFIEVGALCLFSFSTHSDTLSGEQG
jgi:hypothetical protein